MSGDVTVRLPESVGVHAATARNVSGHVVVDGRDYGATRGRLVGSFDAVVGDGACHVHVTTVSGERHACCARTGSRY